ncbi:tRNA(Ile)-lysidine synthase [Pseudoxanthomonas sp. GM95]|uniref:tRNA lysidine(34) synthetase TilS n=1 Tax=Pseudoxanthomonas sp. GM95 TaxID=1881043 RepID=UPI0008C35EE2|nr:tRNA lysidine(34) synthetase TilS [Pseudoxanthomonas sp. GM95]SEL80179.1 tRNA(Ile)-lysidine synthase [Pseudoxanthomonas sp. GM95]
MSALLDALAALPVSTPPPRLRVALSGGLDSTALLHAVVAQWQGRAEIHAIHVHHGLQADADAWAAHCAALCARLRVPLEIVRVQVDRNAGEGLEAAARRARHAAFAQVMAPGEVLVAAHHQDDQAETFLLRALRASGPEGLAAMRPWRAFASGWLWRPWLDQPRSAITTYAQANTLEWIEDDSNADTTLDRNFLRHQILPLLRQRWPQAGAVLARSAALSAQASALLSTQDAIDLQAARSADPHVLSMLVLQTMPPSRRARVLRHWIAERALPPLPARGIAQFETSLLPARSDAQARFAWDGAWLCRWGDQLHAGRDTPALPQDWQTTWDGREALSLPDGGQLALHGADGFDTPLQVGARRGGERITLPCRTHSHALKHVLQDARIPPWQRLQLPLLRDAEGEVLAAGDAIVAAGFARWLDERGARLAWSPPSRD